MSTRQPSPEALLSLAIRQRSTTVAAENGRFTIVVIKPSELPLQAARPAIGLPRSVLIERALGESRGYDPHAARRRYYAAIVRLAGRHEMIVAARDKKLEAARENRKLKRPRTLVFVA